MFFCLWFSLVKLADEDMSDIDSSAGSEESSSDEEKESLETQVVT